MNNETSYNEEEAATKRLLDAVCEGVEVPTDAEERETALLQGGTHGELDSKNWTERN